MLRLPAGLLAIVVFGGESATPAPFKWPHRATVESRSERPVGFRAYTLGGEFIITVDKDGRFTQKPAAVPNIRPLTSKDTIHGQTPASFMLDLSKGPVVFVADGTDSLHLIVGYDFYGNALHAGAYGRKFTARLAAGQLVIDAR